MFNKTPPPPPHTHTPYEYVDDAAKLFQGQVSLAAICQLSKHVEGGGAEGVYAGGAAGEGRGGEGEGLFA
jgi:hypothetical protein